MLERPSSIDQLRKCLDRFKRIRASQPVSYDEAGQSWHLVCYQEVLQVLADTSRFVPPGADGAASPPTSSTGPLFPRVAQRLLSQVLTPRSVSELTPRVIEITHSLLGGVRQAGTMDVIEDFAAPLSSSVIAELLGIPLEQRGPFMEWAKAQRKDPADGQAEEISLLFSELIAQRRERPQQDLISTLLTTCVDNSLASEADIAASLHWLVGTGFEMVTHLLGNAVLCLLMHPQVIERLHQDPAPIYSTIEEALRYLPPVWRVTRMTTDEVALGGQRIPAQARVCAWIVSANRDERCFSSPDTFDIERVPNRHLSFGYGKDFHFDAALARLLAEVSLTLLLDYLPNLKLLPGQRLEVVDNPAIFGLRHIYITFSSTSASM
ncbi:MAG TPA: cytochrome P450 [Ktedonobacteraceae bacterium]